MLATKGDAVPTGPGWSHEVKWDGVRVLADATVDDVVLHSRNGNVITAGWPDVAMTPGRDLLVDGEVIALNQRGLPDFRMLADRLHQRQPARVAALASQTPAIYMAFDLLRLDGVVLVDRPWHERRSLLENVDLGASGWQVPSAHEDGRVLESAAREQGLEGIVSKRASSRYRFGERSRDWIKLPFRHRASYVVGGWRPQEGTTDRLAALLVGEPTAAGLAYRGRVGSGIGAAASRRLTELVASLGRAVSPFVDEVPRVDARGTHWLEPVLVIDIETHGARHDARSERLRQPSFQGVRTDLGPEDLPVADAPVEEG